MLTREQAKAFLATLWPAGHMSYLDSPTRTFLAALIGRVPQDIPWNDKGSDDMAKLREIAAILRSVASHIEVSEEDAADGERCPF